jgi:hypothetical protein
LVVDEGAESVDDESTTTDSVDGDDGIDSDLDTVSNVSVTMVTGMVCDKICRSFSSVFVTNTVNQLLFASEKIS